MVIKKYFIILLSSVLIMLLHPVISNTAKRSEKSKSDYLLKKYRNNEYLIIHNSSDQRILRFLVAVFVLALLSFCQPKETPFPKTNGNLEYFIKGTEVNFREGPGKNYKINRRFTEGETVYPVGMENGNTYFIDSKSWLKVITQNKESGWVSSEFVSAKFLGIKSGIFMSTDEKESDGKYRLSMLAGIADHKLIFDLEKLSGYIQKNSKADYFAYDMGGRLTGEFKNPMVEKSEHLELSRVRMDKKYSLEKTFEPKIVSDLYGYTITEKNQSLARKLSSDSPEAKKIISLFENAPGIFSCMKETVLCSFYEVSIFKKKYIFYHIRAEQELMISSPRSYYGFILFEENELTQLKAKLINMSEFSISHSVLNKEHFSALTDIDEDGVYELWTQTDGWEWSKKSMYLIEKNFILKVMDCRYDDSSQRTCR